MNALSGYTKTQLLKIINDVKIKHNTLKQDIINLTYEMDNIEITINEKALELENIEKFYIDLVEEISK